MTKRNILIIDDEKAFCDLVKMNLEMSGKFKVSTASNGKDGIKIAKSDKPDLILLDIKMPKMGGFEVLDSLKGDSALMPVPVIMLSAISDETTKIESSKKMSEYYITKPVATDELIGKIEWVLNMRGKSE